MRKAEVQALYKQVKSRRRTTSSQSFFAGGMKRTGCRTCGKVTWRPNQGN